MGCTRLVYNRALAARTSAWYERQERVGYAETSAMLTLWKQEAELQCDVVIVATSWKSCRLISVLGIVRNVAPISTEILMRLRIFWRQGLPCQSAERV
jgi:Helix-turn-helix domain